MLFISFIFGFLVGTLCWFAVTYFAGKRLESFINKIEMIASAQKRMSKVKEITMKQLNLLAQVEAPQKNSLDGKYKNILISEIQSLEEEKIEILRSLIKDNLDLKIVILDEHNQVKTMKLSEYMNLMGLSNLKDQAQNNLKSIRKFTIHEGKKLDDDDDGDNSNKTFH